MRFVLGLAFLDSGHLLDMARTAEESGYFGVAMSDHIFGAKTYNSSYLYSVDGAPPFPPGTHWPDSWVTIGAMASITTRLRFTTDVYIAPARDVFTVAKLVSTAAVLSDNRVSLGLAPGWCREEFEATGQQFNNRGKRLEEMMHVMRHLWTGEMVDFHGQFYDFPLIQMNPAPTAPIALIVGGESETALSRAARVGDGWMGTEYTVDDCEAIVANLLGKLAAAGRPAEGFEVALSLKGEPSVEVFKRLEKAGVTTIVCSPWWEPLLDGRTERRDLLDAVSRFGNDIIQRMDV